MHNDTTAVMIVLNNAEGAERCLNSLQSLGLAEIIVVDGGSTDGTIETVKRYNVKLHEIEKKGLAHARQYGVDRVETHYVLLVDSDNILNEGALQKMKEELCISNFVGIAAGKVSFNRHSYFGRTQEWINNLGVNIPGEKLVIGTPAIYQSNVLKQVRYNTAMTLADDTDLCFRLRNRGFIVGTSSAKIEEEIPRTLIEFFAKAFRYGISDSQFFIAHPKRRLSIGTHVFRNYLLKMLPKTLSPSGIEYAPGLLVYTLARTAGLYLRLIKRIFTKS